MGGIWWDIGTSTKKDIKRQTNTSNGIQYRYIVAAKNTMECHWDMAESGSACGQSSILRDGEASIEEKHFIIFLI